jgi:hypothetical protein
LKLLWLQAERRPEKRNQQPSNADKVNCRDLPKQRHEVARSKHPTGARTTEDEREENG